MSTRLKQTHAENKELFHLITRNAMDIIAYADPDGIIRYISPSVRDLLGYDPEEIVGKSTFDLNHPKDMEKIMSKPISDSEVFTYRIRHKQGHYVWFEITVKMIRDGNGDVQKLFGIGRDITVRKKYEERLAVAQRVGKLGSWEWDFQSNKLTLSDQVREMFGLDENHPDNLFYLIHPNDHDQFSIYLDQALKGNDFSAEFRHQSADGAIKYIQISVSVLFDEHGAPTSIQGTTQDVTDRKEVETKLQKSVQRYLSLKKYNHDAVISFDLDGTIIHANAMSEKLTGYAVKELAGQSLGILIGGCTLAKVISEFADNPSVEKSIDKITNIDGRHVAVLATIAPIIVNNENTGFYLIAKDMTEHKKLLFEKETAERTNKAKSDFLAMMSHEIRTPMNGVIGLTDLMLTTELNEEQKEFMQVIRKSADTLLAIINDILDFSKIESGMVEMHNETFCIDDCLADTLDLFAPRAAEKRLAFSVSVDADVPRALIGDSDKLKQVLINLVGNAVKFTNAGSVAVSVKKTAAESGGEALLFAVEDTGVGISEDKRDRLFEPFYQSGDFKTRNGEGTGLGLAISKKLIQLMGGDIAFKPTDGAGATFVFSIPLKADNSPAATAAPAEPPIHSRYSSSLKILVAEDNKINQLVLIKILEKLGYPSVSIAENGNEVIEAVAKHSYDIVFMDVNMPKMNGLDATRLIKKTMSSEKQPAIIGVTANALKGDREICLSAGMVDYVSKPFILDSIVEVLRKHAPG